ncbi:MAG: tetratricopeptide repeat protein [Myxococcota bacterium]
MRVAAILCVLLLAAAVGCTSKETRIAEQRTAADAFFEEKEWSEAKIAYMNLLQIAPNDAEAHYKMAETLWAMQEYGEALWQYKEASRLAPENTEWRMRLTQVLFAARDYDTALEQVSAVLEKDAQNIDALLLRGALKSVKGDIDGLLEDVEASLAINPDHPDSLALKAQALGRKGDIAGAEEALRKLVAVKPTASNHLSVARFLAIIGKNDEALVELNAAIAAAEKPEERTQARLFLTNFYINQGQNDKAEEVLLEARADAPDDASVLLTLARFYYAVDKGEQAEAMLEESVKMQPDSAEPLLVLADYHRRAGNVAQAIADVDRAIAVEPKSEAARLRRAELIVDQKGEEATPTEESWTIVREVLKDNPRSLLGLFTEGKFYLLDKKYAEAATSLRRVIDEQPSAAAHVLLGTAYLAQKQNDLARSEFLQALQVDAQYTPARSQLSALYLGAGEDENAAREAKLVLDQSPKDLRIRLILAEALTRLKRIHEAREVLRPIEVTEAMPAPMRLKIAQLYRRTRDTKAAAPILQALLKENPTDPAAMGELIQADLDERNHEAALVKIDAFLEEQPDNVPLYEMRAKVRLASPGGDKPESIELALADLNTSIEKDPKRVETVVTLGKLYRTMWQRDGSHLDDSINAYKKARELDPQNALIALELAALTEQAGRYPEAIENYETVLRLDQDQAGAKNNLAWLLADNANASPADLDRALQLAQDAKNAMPNDPSVADTLGWVMYKKGIPSAAIALFRESIDGYPEGHPLRGTVRYHLAAAYEKNGERDRAVQELKRALDEDSNFNEREAAEKLLKELQAG